MELQQLRYVVAVAEEKSFTQAAERCHVVQSALSHQVKALEREIGVRLFARTSRRVEITAAGRAFLPHARQCLEAAARAVADAAAAEGLVRGTLSIGVIPTVTEIDVPAALGEFRRRHPAVRVTLRDGGSDAFVTAIRAGELDIAVLGLPEGDPPRGVRFREVARERLSAAVPADHPLAREPSVALADLAPETFVDFPSGTPGRRQSELAFTAAGQHRDVALEAMSVRLILDLVRQGLAITLLASGMIPQEDPAIRRLPVRDGPGRVEYLAWSDLNPTPAARAFLEVLTGAERG